MVKKIIICAFSVHPDQKSSEAIVNGNWLNILSRNGLNIEVLSAFNNYFDLGGNNEVISKLNLSLFLFNSSKQEKSVSRIFYSISNKIFMKLFTSQLTLQNYLWVNYQGRILESRVKDKNVVWARILPVLSLMPVLKAYSNKKFPFIVNVNDPIALGKFDNHNMTYDQEIFILTRDKAQAWTFPSSKLADQFADDYNLDRSRCFVIPHSMKKVSALYKRDIKKKQLNFLYAGTFYKSAFTNEFKESLSKFAGLEISKLVQFTFVLSQYDNDSLAWLKSTIPNVEIKLKLERPVVLDLIKTSDCMFVIDSLLHANLLKGKLIEAISFGIPVFAATYENSVMDKVVKEYGGLSAYQDSEGDILYKMKSLIISIQSDKWLQNFYSQRNIVLDKISESTIVKSTEAVNEFAYCRFNKVKDYSNSFSVLRELNWP